MPRELAFYKSSVSTEALCLSNFTACFSAHTANLGLSVLSQGDVKLALVALGTRAGDGAHSDSSLARTSETAAELMGTVLLKALSQYGASLAQDALQASRAACRCAPPAWRCRGGASPGPPEDSAEGRGSLGGPAPPGLLCFRRSDLSLISYYMMLTREIRYTLTKSVKVASKLPTYGRHNRSNRCQPR